MAGVTRLREYRRGTEASFREILPLKERKTERERERERESVLAERLELILRNGEVKKRVFSEGPVSSLHTSTTIFL